VVGADEKQNNDFFVRCQQMHDSLPLESTDQANTK